MISLVTGDLYSHDNFYSSLCSPFLHEKNFLKVVWIERWVAGLCYRAGWQRRDAGVASCHHSFLGSIPVRMDGLGNLRIYRMQGPTYFCRLPYQK
jgi:hypothetical protein